MKIDLTGSGEYAQFELTNVFAGIDIDLPDTSNLPEIRDRFVLFLTCPFSFNVPITWLYQGTILWENNIVPSVINNEIIKFEFWKGGSSTEWFASFKSFRDYTPSIVPQSVSYDIGFSSAGLVQPDSVLGSFNITRNIAISTPADSSFAFANVATTDGPYSLDLIVKSNNGANILNIGSITFNIGDNTGILNIGTNVNLVPGDVVQLISNNSPTDSTLKDISLTIVGCSTLTTC